MIEQEAYSIASEINKYFDTNEQYLYTCDEFEEQIALAVRKLYGIDNIWEIADENGNIEINGKTFDGNELLMDIRGILSYDGYETILEGERGGDIANTHCYKEIRPYLDTILEDDETETGGTSYQGETLFDFLMDLGDDHIHAMDEVNDALIECRIKPIKTDKKVI